MLLNFKNGHTPNVNGPFLVKVKSVLIKKGYRYMVLYWSNKTGAWFTDDKKQIYYPGKVDSWVRIREN